MKSRRSCGEGGPVLKKVLRKRRKRTKRKGGAPPSQTVDEEV